MTTAEHLMLATLVYGYEPGRMCKPDQEAGEVDFGWSPDWKDVPQGRYPYCVMHMLPLPHEIPPPPVDTYEAMGKIIEALWKRGHAVDVRRPLGVWPAEVRISNFGKDAYFQRIIDDNLIAAVCEAALQVLRREEQK